MIVRRPALLPLLARVEDNLGCARRRQYATDLHLEMRLVIACVVLLYARAHSVRRESAAMVLLEVVLLGAHDAGVVDQWLVLLGDVAAVISLSG